MCREGAKGDEIIEALIANSKTFDKKFQLSQVMYILFNLSASTLKFWETYIFIDFLVTLHLVGEI